MSSAETEMVQLIVMMPLMFVLFGWIFKVIWDGKRTKIKSSLLHKLLDKYSDVKELNDFLKTDGGSDFLDALTLEGLAPREKLFSVLSKEKLLSAISKGIILGFVGIASLILGFVFKEDSTVFYTIGIIVVTLGLGFLTSSLVSFNLSKKWGIIEDEKE